jgi:hypothetical protein
VIADFDSSSSPHLAPWSLSATSYKQRPGLCFVARKARTTFNNHLLFPVRELEDGREKCKNPVLRTKATLTAYALAGRLTRTWQDASMR